MGQHGSAHLTVHSRLAIAKRVTEQGWSITEAASAASVSRQTASKWVRRFLDEGEAGLLDRSTRPRRTRPRVAAGIVRKIARLRRARLGTHQIAWLLGMARSSVYAVCRRLGLGRLGPVEPRPEPNRYEWPAPGTSCTWTPRSSAGWGRARASASIPHSGRATRRLGWTVVHIAIDDHSRLAYVEELPDEFGETAAAFLARALGHFASLGITVRRVMTDNGSPYVSKAFAQEIAARELRHIRTRPYTPRTNGKAEAMVKILLNGWAYARPYASDAQRSAALPRFVDFYNHQRPHGGLNGARPIDRVRQ